MICSEAHSLQGAELGFVLRYLLLPWFFPRLLSLLLSVASHLSPGLLSPHSALSLTAAWARGLPELPDLMSRCCVADSLGESVHSVLLGLAVRSFPYSMHLKSQHETSLMLALKMFGHFKIQTHILCSWHCFPPGITHTDAYSLRCLQEGTVRAACCWWADG